MPKPPSNPPLSVCPRCGQVIPAHAVLGACPHCLLAAGLASEPAAPGNTPPPSPAELAPEFPQLDLLELLGRGGMGAVYKARQHALDRFVALKLLRPGLGADPSFSERFAREARALAQLNHPGIVTLYEFGRTPGGLFFILMEFVDGVNLRQLLAAGRLAPREALAIIPPLCDALQYAHDRGLVHRDIKPENILVDRLGRVKVADFGLAKLADRTEPAASASGGTGVSPAPARGEFSVDLTEAGKVMGTPRYMAPEQSERPAEVDHRADIYALGVVLYQMLTGELPDAKRLQPPSRRVQLDVRLDEIVLRALEKEPSRRYQDASALKTQVENVSGMDAIHAAETGARQSPPLPPGRSIAGRPIAVAVVAALLAGYGLDFIADAAASSPGEYYATFEVIAFPIGLGVWRLRPWWRYTALAFVATMLVLFALWMALMVALAMNSMPAFFTDNFDIDFHPTYFKDQPTVAALFLASVHGLRFAVAVWIWRILRRPGIKALFASSRRWSRPWLEWTAFACAQLLAFLGTFLMKPSIGFGREAAPTVVSSPAQPNPTPIAATPVATAVTPTSDETQRKILQLKLEQAQRDLDMMKAKFDAGLATDERMQDARRDVALLKAELTGDPVVIAQVKLAAAEEKLKLLNARYSAGLSTKHDVETASLAVAVYKVEVKAATTHAQSQKPGPVAPAQFTPENNPLAPPSFGSSVPASTLPRQTSMTVTVLGAVIYPNSYQLPAGSTLLDALAAAGGVNAIANPGTIAVAHIDGAGKRTTTQYDLNAILKARAKSPGIAAGDIVFVDERIL